MEKVGRKFQIVEIYQEKKVDKLFRVGEGHLENSSKLLLDYMQSFKESCRFKPSEQFPEIIETLLYSADIGEICGYLDDRYRDVRDDNTEWAEKLKTSRVALSLFSKLMGEELNQTRRQLLEALKKKGVIYHYRKVLIGLDEEGNPTALLDDEVAKYNQILESVCSPLGKATSTFGLSSDNWKEFHKQLRLTTLGRFQSIFTGYYVAFTEKSISKGLENVEKIGLKMENREYFSSKLVLRLAKWLEKATLKVEAITGWSEKESFEEKIVYNRERIAELEKLISEFSGEQR